MAQGSSANFFNSLNNDSRAVSTEDFDYIKHGYNSVSAVFECVDLIMKKIVASPAIIYEVKSEQKLKMYDNLSKSENVFDRAKAFRMKSDAIVEVDVPDIRNLIESPNDNQTYDEMIGLLSVLYLLTGNGLLYGNAGSEDRIKKRQWSEIFALPFKPQDITLVGGSIFEPVKQYVIAPTGNTAQMTFEGSSIEHFKTVNPTWTGDNSNKFGQSVLMAYTHKLIRERLGDEQANKILNNGGIFGILSPKNKEDQFEGKQKRGLREQMTDARKSNEELARIFPVSVPLDFLEIGLPSADLEILSMAKAGREDIYRGYHVPLTYASTDQASYNNANAHGKQLIYNAVAPICDVFGRGLTNFICKPYSSKGKNYIIRLDYMSLPELSQDMKETAEWLAKCDDLSFNEKREAKGYGRKDSPGMDDIWVKRGSVLMQDVVDGKVNNGNVQEVTITE